MKNLILVVFSVISAGKYNKIPLKMIAVITVFTDKEDFLRIAIKTAQNEIFLTYQNYRFFISRANLELSNNLISNPTFASILASCNEFIVLNSPKSIEFKGTSDLPAESLSEVLSATLGYSIQSSNIWDGLFVNDPFNTAKSVVSVVVEGSDDLKFKVNVHVFFK